MLKSNIPFIDLRGKPMIDLVRAFPDQAAALLKASRRTFGWASYVASALGLVYSDKRSLKWLKRTRDPYLHEIEAAAELLGKKGIYTLNLAYEWGCTSGAYMVGENVKLFRVLDWPFPALGKYAVVALQNSDAGEYYNITWPGLSGVYQAMAPGRFAASINQAPMRKHRLGYLGDWVVNRVRVSNEKGIPPAHLLRQVFDKAKSYAEAKDMLCKTPLAMPVIFTLTGLRPGEGCVIERLENAAEIKELSAGQAVSASNEFLSGFAGYGRGWRPRALDSAGRYKQSLAIAAHDLQHDNFSWLRPPILNQYTRLVVKADAKTGTLMVQGYEGQSEVTNTFAILPIAKAA